MEYKHDNQHDKVYAVESAIMKFTGPKFDLRQVRDIYK